MFSSLILTCHKAVISMWVSCLLFTKTKGGIYCLNLQGLSLVCETGGSHPGLKMTLIRGYKGH